MSCGSSSSSLMDDFSDLELSGFIYNEKYGGFWYSDKFIKRLNEKRVERGLSTLEKNSHQISLKRKLRFDPLSIEVFNELGTEESSASCATLKIELFPKALIQFVKIDEYDGQETVFLNIDKIYSNMIQTFFEKERNETSNLTTIQDLETKYFETKRLISRYHDYKKRLFDLKR